MWAGGINLVPTGNFMFASLLSVPALMADHNKASRLCPLAKIQPIASESWSRKTTDKNK
jgi:hypothetical protein